MADRGPSLWLAGVVLLVWAPRALGLVPVVGVFLASPAFLAGTLVLAIWLAVTEAGPASGRGASILPFALAVACADLPFLASGGELPAPIWLASLGAAALAIGSCVAWKRIGVGGRLSIWQVSAVALAMVAIFQLSNRQLRAEGVPNEDRSVLVGGFEVHHYTWGLLLLAALLPGMGWRKGRFPSALAAGVALGMAWDQWLYVGLTGADDDLYFAPVTWVSALGAAVIVPAIAAWKRRAGGSKPPTSEAPHVEPPMRSS